MTTADQFVSIVREIDSEWFGVTWDSGNFRSADPYTELTRSRRTRSPQIKTRVGGKPADLQRVVGILKAVDYRGWVALESEDGGTEDGRAEIPRRASAPHCGSLTRFSPAVVRRTNAISTKAGRYRRRRRRSRKAAFVRHDATPSGFEGSIS
jgi:hypothetical protein